MELDLHIHTNQYSGCSNIDPVALLKHAKQVGLDGIALTEHSIRWPDEKIDRLREAAGVGEDFIILPGQEIACYAITGKFQGEVLVFGYPKSLGSNKSIEQVIEIVHENGGVVVAAHPFKRADKGEGFYGAGELVYDLHIDGLEVLHPSYDEEGKHLSQTAMKKMCITGIGVSDAHDLNQVGTYRTLFETSVDNIEALCEEIRQGRAKAIGG